MLFHQPQCLLTKGNEDQSEVIPYSDALYKIIKVY